MVRDISFNIKMSKEERDYYKAMAGRCGISLATLIRVSLYKELQAVEKSIEARTQELNKRKAINEKLEGEY